EPGLSLSHKITLCATLVLLWAGSLEISRLVDLNVFPGSVIWSHLALKNLAWTSLWTIGSTAYFAWTTKLNPVELRANKQLAGLAVFPVVVGIKYLSFDTVLAHGFAPAPVALLFNAQAATGALVLGGLVFLRFLLPTGSRLRFVATAVAVLIPLWCGTAEIGRAFTRSPAIASRFADPRLAMQVALSIFFSLYAIASVTLGFTFRTAGLRYFGLALFALTLGKVAVLDLSTASTGYRFLSFMGLGALLLITSVLYGKLSPRILHATQPEAS
ncbi:MAG TPA: DUF2339 domain-containing protein, partial [Tepidisphaeraceae bacterium]